MQEKILQQRPWEEKKSSGGKVILAFRSQALPTVLIERYPGCRKPDSTYSFDGKVSWLCSGGGWFHCRNVAKPSSAPLCWESFPTDMPMACLLCSTQGVSPAEMPMASLLQRKLLLLCPTPLWQKKIFTQNSFRSGHLCQGGKRELPTE